MQASVQERLTLAHEQLLRHFVFLQAQVVSSSRLLGAGSFIISSGCSSPSSIIHPCSTGEEISCIPSREFLHTYVWVVDTAGVLSQTIKSWWKCLILLFLLTEHDVSKLISSLWSLLRGWIDVTYKCFTFSECLFVYFFFLSKQTKTFLMHLASEHCFLRLHLTDPRD